MPDKCTDNGRHSPENIRKSSEPDRTKISEKNVIEDDSPDEYCRERSRTPERKNKHKKKRKYRSRSRSFSSSHSFSSHLKRHISRKEMAQSNVRNKPSCTVSKTFDKAGISPSEIPYGTDSEISEVRNIKVINQKRSENSKKLFVVIQNDQNNNESQNFVDIGNPNRYRDLESSSDESRFSVRSEQFRSSRKRKTHDISKSPVRNENSDMSDYD